jgi:hypothetical protein
MAVGTTTAVTTIGQLTNYGRRELLTLLSSCPPSLLLCSLVPWTPKQLVEGFTFVDHFRRTYPSILVHKCQVRRELLWRFCLFLGGVRLVDCSWTHKPQLLPASFPPRTKHSAAAGRQQQSASDSTDINLRKTTTQAVPNCHVAVVAPLAHVYILPACLVNCVTSTLPCLFLRCLMCMQYCNGAGTVTCPHCGGFKLRQPRTAAGQLTSKGNTQLCKVICALVEVHDIQNWRGYCC